MSKVLAIIIGAFIGAGVVSLICVAIKFIHDYRFYKQQYNVLLEAFVMWDEYYKEKNKKSSEKAQKEPQKEEILTKCCEYEEE